MIQLRLSLPVTLSYQFFNNLHVSTAGRVCVCVSVYVCVCTCVCQGGSKKVVCLSFRTIATIDLSNLIFKIPCQDFMIMSHD